MSGPDRPSFPELCAHAAGVRSPEVERALGRDPVVREEYELARRLVEAGRGARAGGGPSPSARRRAMRRFRRHHGPRRPLAIAFDSAGAADAIRAPASATPRLVRLRGEGLSVLIHLTPGVDVHGEIDPPDAADEVAWSDGRRLRVAKVDARGEFVLRGLSRGAWTLDIGRHRLEDFRP